ncbi:MAG: ubiquinol-cytochrome c reductase iron-sulfur subunit [Hyphomonas sp. 32-62-5]|nr:MAG: ubiquinol-cytochrome c reductase iron-sulfur subunit [Hyphomonas sp. 32-62-5]
MTTETHAETVDDDRRNFIHIATGSVALGGAAMFAWTLVDQWNPAADTRAASALDVDVSKVPLGGEIRILIGGKPFFVRHRTPAEISAAESVNISILPDPETDEARTKKGHEQWLIMIANCTHLGCVPVGDSGDFDGWFCPCHGSHYDSAGRIRKGPAPKNLVVPPYDFVTDTLVKIG